MGAHGRREVDRDVVDGIVAALLPTMSKLEIGAISIESLGAITGGQTSPPAVDHDKALRTCVAATRDFGACMREYVHRKWNSWGASQ
jgi:hypothetical protein